MMEQIPDHPVIQSMERTGYPPGHTRLAPWGEVARAKRVTERGRGRNALSVTALRAATAPPEGEPR